MFGALAKLALGPLAKSIGGQYAKAFPRTIVGKALGGVLGVAKGVVPYAAGATAAGLLMGGPGKTQLPALPTTGTGGALMPSQYPTVGTIPFWRGPGGKLQMPWSDPRVPEFLKQFSLDDAYLRPYYRAPKGYIVLRDANGKPFACMKTIARQFGLWHPKAKPIISIRDWHAYQRAKRVEKKLRKIAGSAIRRHSPGKAVACVPFRKKGC